MSADMAYKPKKIKLVTSDMHLSSGPFLDGKINPHEDFHFDPEFVEFLDYFSTGNYGDECEVELILNGDVLDFLNVPFHGEFPEEITESMALEKLQAIFAGHPEVTKALQRFIRRKGKRIIYNIGNHDAEFFFSKVRALFCETIAGANPSRDKIWVNADEEFIEYPEGIRIHHGNQFEAVHTLNYKNPFLADIDGGPILALPWGSVYVLKIINRLKWERDYLDKVKPAKRYFLIGLIFDPFFMLKFFFLSAFYFFHTRFIYSPRRRATIWNTIKIMRQEITPFFGLEGNAHEILEKNPQVHTIIFGHTHGPMQRIFRDGRTYINTGTWTKMINLDFPNLGTSMRLTFAFVQYDEGGKPKASLEEWYGHHAPHKMFYN